MKIAALTMVFNERHFLPFWIQHYGAAIGRENLYVIDDGSDDGSTTGLGAVNVMRGKRGLLDEWKRAAMIAEIQAELLTRFDAVIFSDVDELLVVDPATGIGLAEYISTRVDTVATPAGLHIQFGMHHELPLKRGIPVFRQRQFVQFDYAYCKTLVSRIPLTWIPGFHKSSAPPVPRCDLFMFHLRSVDPGISLDRLTSFRRIQLSKESSDVGHDQHFSLPDEEYLGRFYFTRKEIFDSALPKDDFDPMISKWMERIRPSDWHQLAEPALLPLLVLPDRFADSIVVPE